MFLYSGKCMFSENIIDSINLQFPAKRVKLYCYRQIYYAFTYFQFTVTETYTNSIKDQIRRLIILEKLAELSIIGLKQMKNYPYSTV